MTMKSIKLNWKAWAGDSQIELGIPDNWDISYSRINNERALSTPEIKKAIRNPIDCQPIREQAAGKVGIAVEDITRPTQLAAVLKTVMDELHKAGIGAENIKIFIALGGHRQMTRSECIAKFGRSFMDTYDVYQHNPYENVIDLGKTSQNTPVVVNRDFYECDYKIGIGTVAPHPWMGFSGGGKIVVPGLAGIETLEANHLSAVRGITGAFGEVQNNQARQDIEEAARKIGLDFIVCTLVNGKRKIAAVYAGDMISAHRQAVARGQKIYASHIIRQPDVVVLNTYPEDSEILQAAKGLNLYHATHGNIVKKGGTVILMSACVFGRGYSALFSPGGRLHLASKAQPGFMAENKLIMFSPNLNEFDCRVSFPGEVEFAANWDDVLGTLKKRHPDGGKIAVYPSATLQIPEI